MRFSCPNCQEPLNVNMEQVPPQGANVRCPKCQNITFITHPATTSNSDSLQKEHEKLPSVAENKIQQVTCPSCKQISKVNPDKIPSQGANLRCPSCQNVFFIPSPTSSSAEPEHLIQPPKVESNEDFKSYLLNETNLPISLQETIEQTFEYSANKAELKESFKKYNQIFKTEIEKQDKNIKNTQKSFFSELNNLGINQNLAKKISGLHLYILLNDWILTDTWKENIINSIIDNNSYNVDYLQKLPAIYYKFQNEVMEASEKYKKALNKQLSKITLNRERIYFSNQLTPLGFLKEDAEQIAAICLISLVSDFSSVSQDVIASSELIGIELQTLFISLAEQKDLKIPSQDDLDNIITSKISVDELKHQYVKSDKESSQEVIKKRNNIYLFLILILLLLIILFYPKLSGSY